MNHQGSPFTRGVRRLFRGGMAVRALVLAVTVALASTGCSLLARPRPIPPDVNFAAHEGYRGLVVDRMGNGQSAVLVSGSASSTVGPTEVLQAEDGTVIAALWVSGDDRVVIRRTPDPAAPVTGEIVASWEHGLLRLAFQPADGAAFHTSRFNRIGREDTPAALDNEMLAVSEDLPGVYRAELRDAQNAPVGWLQARILRDQGLPRDFHGDVPATLNGPLATGAVVLVDAAIDSIIQRNVLPEDRIPEGLVP